MFADVVVSSLAQQSKIYALIPYVNGAIYCSTALYCTGMQPS